MNRKPGYFVSGTGTGVGKTFVGVALARAYRDAGRSVGVYKPVLSGWQTDVTHSDPATWERSPDDDVQLWRAADQPLRLEQVCPQRFRAPLAPHLAARAEGREVDVPLMRSGLEPWLQATEVVLVEGAGGLFSPLSDELLNMDFARELGFPLVLVAPNSLGVIHATIATYRAAEAAGGLRISAIVLNDLPVPGDAAGNAADPSRESNHAELERRLPCPVIRYRSGPFPWQDLR